MAAGQLLLLGVGDAEAAAGGTNRLELEGTTDDLLLEDGSGALELEN